MRPARFAASRRDFGLTEFRVVQAGLREGIIRAAAANPAGWWLDAQSGSP